MDGQAYETQQEIENMMGNLNKFFDHIRNTFVNATDLARKVDELQTQMQALSAQVQQVTAANQALQEAVNVLTHERDVARQEASQTGALLREMTAKYEQRNTDANHWYSEFQQVSEELDKAKADRRALEEDHLKLMGDHEQTKETLAKIKGLFRIEEPKADVDPGVVEPMPQPRDPVTQQWRSPYDTSPQS